MEEMKVPVYHNKCLVWLPGDSIESLSKTLVPANDPKPQDGGGDTSTTEHEETDQGIVSDDCTPVHSDAIRGGGTDTEEDAYDNAPPRPLGYAYRCLKTMSVFCVTC